MGERRIGLLVAALATLPLFLLVLIIVAGSENRDRLQTASGTYGTGLAAKKVPKAVVPWILKSAEQCDSLTAPLLAAQLDAESRFRANARSTAGAQGIAQFMPGTWERWGRDADGNGYASPFDIGDSVMAQGRYMCFLFDAVKDYPGDRTELALAAYNAGPGNVKAFGGVPPYPETRAYVKRIRAGIGRFTAADTGDVVFPLPAGSSWVDNGNWGSSGSHWSSVHTGDDFSVPCGTPVRAATGGTVEVETDQGWSGRWLVKVSTGPGRLTTWYAHMEGLSTEDGRRVRAGQQLGYVGAQGNATGCHLHFEYHPRGGSMYEDSTDPVPWLKRHHAYPNPDARP